MQRQDADITKLERYVRQLVDDQGGIDAGTMEAIVRDLEKGAIARRATKQVTSVGVQPGRWNKTYLYIYIPVHESVCLDFEDHENRAFCYMDGAPNSAWQRCGVLAPMEQLKPDPRVGVGGGKHSRATYRRIMPSYCSLLRRAFVSFALGLLPALPPPAVLSPFSLRCTSCHNHAVS